jgi:hypothetical protein
VSGALRYPLAALQALRERRQARARAGVAGALAELERRGAACEGARRLALARHEEARRAAAAATAASGAAVRAADLGQRVAFAERLRVEARTLGAAAQREEDALRRAEEELGARREALGAARSAVRAVERHRERWHAAAARMRHRREDADEDDAVNAWRALP